MTDNVVYEALGRIEQKVDGLASRFDESAGGDVRRDERISKLESRQNWLFGVMATVGSIFGLVGKTLYDKITS